MFPTALSSFCVPRSCFVRVYVSGSAYKIVKDRAYHHGTMLISTQLDTLGELLRSNKVRAVYAPLASSARPH